MSAWGRTIPCSPPPPARSPSSVKATDANMYRYARQARQNKAGSKTRTPLRRQAPRTFSKANFRDEIEGQEPAHSSGKPSLRRGCGRCIPFVVFGPVTGALTGDLMFPDLARDDVFL